MENENPSKQILINFYQLFCILTTQDIKYKIKILKFLISCSEQRIAAQSINRKEFNMKKIYAKIISLLLIALTAAAFSGCGDNGSSSSVQQTTAPVTTVQETTRADTPNGNNENTKLPFPKYAENGDDFTGAWKITEGEGSQYGSFVFSFNGEGRAAMVIDNSGYFGKYEIEQKNGKNAFTTQMIFGLNGEYTYKLSDDKNTITLTNNEDNSAATMQRVESFDCVPSVENVKIDEDLLGAWKSEDEDTFYFDESGIMYHNQYNTMFNYAAYTAENSKITATYSMGSEMTDEYEYSLEGGTLKLNGYEYERISVSEVE